MGFQTKIDSHPPVGKQPTHLIGYFADSIAYSTCVKSSRIINSDGAVDIDVVTQILVAKHPVGTEILFHAVSNIGLQDC